jgi:hypothetical protein
MTNNISRLANNINVRLNALLKKTKKNTNKNKNKNKTNSNKANTKNNRWRKSYNDEEKKFYYTSKSEQKSVWDLPPGAVVNNSPRKFYRIGNSANWQKVKDSDGMSWYENKKSKELTWVQPENQVFTNINPPQEVPEVAEPEPNAPTQNKGNNNIEYLVGSSANWQKVQNGKGETWYVNNKTSTSQWNTPVGVVFTNVNPKQKLAKNVPEPNKANNDVEYLIGSSANWQKIQNGKGETWYVDNKTTQSQWNAPAGVVFTNVNPKEKIFRKNIQEPQNIGAIYKKYLIAKSNDGWEKIENERGEKWYSNKGLQKAEWYAPKGVVFTNVKTREESKNALEEPGGAPPKNN